MHKLTSSCMMPIIMNILSIENLSKTVKDAPLFSGITLGLEQGERYGLIGKNGAGKSTFLKLIAGQIQPDTGTIAIRRNLEIGMLEQTPQFDEAMTVREYFFAGKTPKIDTLNKYRACLAAYDHGKSSEQELTALHEKMDDFNLWTIEHDYLSFLSELQIPDPDARMKTLSGGMQKKTALARELAARPDLLLLDEPTNHLDISTIEWLENYVLHASISLIMVTHDRYILDKVCTGILELDAQKIYSYPGNYTVFLTRREQRMAELESSQNRIEAILRRELEWLKRGPKARAGKDRGRKMRIQDLMDAKVLQEQEMSEFSSSHRRLGKKILEVKSISKHYSGRQVIASFSYNFRKGERIGLVGANGSGKSTLLDMLTGHVIPDSGDIDTGIHTHFGYYDQTSRQLPLQKTVLEFISDTAETIDIGIGKVVSAAKFLELFNFPASFHRIPIELLSGGERRRLLLLQTLAASPNFLVLDEPTNDLDIDTIRKLEEYLMSFSGCSLIVSHDRAFLDRTVDYLFIFDGEGQVKGFPGSYSEYHEDTLQQAAEAIERNNEKQKSSIPSKLQDTSVPDRPAKRTGKGLTFKEQKEYESLLSRIEERETAIQLLEESFSDPSSNPDTLSDRTRDYQRQQNELETDLERWAELEEKKQD